MLGTDVGARLAGQVRAALGLAAEARLPAGLRLYGGADLHLTLFFLGAVTEERRAALEPALAGAIRGLRAPALELRAAGAFPDARRPRVLWVGAREHAPERLAAIVEAVRRACVAQGFEADPRPFAAHVTVGRMRGDRERGRGPGRGRRTASEGGLGPGFFALDPQLAWQPEEVALVESRGGAEGDAYQPLCRWPLSS